MAPWAYTRWSITRSRPRFLPAPSLTPIALGASGTDGIFACPERNGVGLLSQYVTTYAYEFNDENAPPAQSLFGGFLSFPLGAYHTAELQYLFIGDFFGLPVAPLSPEQEQLSDAMISYWTRSRRREIRTRLVSRSGLRTTR